MISSRRNPSTGATHPDLFAGQAKQTPSPATNMFGKPILMFDVEPGHTPIFVAVEDVPFDDLIVMPRAMFSNDEWDELPEDVQAEIEANDDDSRERVEDLTGKFVRHYEWENDGSNRDFEHVEHSFEYWLRETNGSLDGEVPDALREQMDAAAEAAFLGEQPLLSIINEVMVDSNNYAFNPPAGNVYRTGRPIWTEEIEGNLYMEGDDYHDELAACTPDEVDRAIEAINKETNRDVDLDAADLKKGRTVDIRWDTGDVFRVYANWNRILEAVLDAIAEVDVPDDANKPGTPPPEERVVYRWPDGFYVLDLVPSELLAEGKAMGMCVGQPSMGYGKAVRDGEIKILSLRRPSGKPLFTFEAPLTEDLINGFDQIKGKANRLPGFDLNKSGLPYIAAMKRDEVQRVFEFVELGNDAVTVDDVDDLRPAVDCVRMLYMEGDAWATKLVDKVGLDKHWGHLRGPAAVRSNPGPACATHGAACGGFCVPYRRRRRRR